MVLLYKGDERRGAAWRARFAARLPEVEFRTWPAVGVADEVRYVATWTALDDLARQFPNLEVLFSTGAGVDQFDLDAIPPRVELVRLIDPAIVAGMREYVVLGVLALQRNLLDYRIAQAAHAWQPRVAKRGGDLTVGVLGLGVLGRAALDALETFEYSLCAWSRTPHEVDGVDCYAGAEALYEFASRCDIVVCLLPLTDATRGVLDRRLFDAMPRGGGLVNAGRGAQLQDDDLLAALDDGQLAGAVLDVMHEEPPPAEHPFWDHERIIVTPHVAAMTGLDSAADALIDNIRRHRQGEPMVGVVDRSRRY